jgi:hypothetical protein
MSARLRVRSGHGNAGLLHSRNGSDGLGGLGSLLGGVPFHGIADEGLDLGVPEGDAFLSVPCRCQVLRLKSRFPC